VVLYRQGKGVEFNKEKLNFINMMSVIGFIIGFFAPRLFSIYLYFFTGWFAGVFQTKGWPILGFIFLPRTMLWYSVVSHWFGGQWGVWQYVLLVVAILIDLGAGGKSAKDRKPYGCF
jgi:hypothetical protein